MAKWHRGVLVLVCLCLSTGQARADDLYRYYLGKFTPQQNAMYERAADALFTDVDGDGRTQARQEMQAYSFVVYHRTRWHDLRNNVGLTHAYAATIEKACHQFGVPFPMALAILSWENSGSTQAMSGSACAGMGQMSSGAVFESHLYASLIDIPATLLYRFCQVGRQTVAPFVSHRTPLYRLLQRQESQWAACATAYRTVLRHQRMLRRAKVTDERMLPACNIEDSVLFMKLLLLAYDQRIDLAMSAYHNGMRNNDDLLRDYLRRVDPGDAAFSAADRMPLWKALQVRHITYLTVWNDRRCREMLNGLRTMDGDVTTPANRSEALGDESDIYPWKVASALAAWMATPAEVADLEDHFDGPQEEAETRGLKVTEPLTTLVSKGHRIKVAPELAGYLRQLQERLSAVVGARAQVAIVAGARPRAVTVEVGSSRYRPALGALLNEDWLFDRIYLSHGDDGRWRIRINPRFGRDYLTPSKTAGP